MPIYMLGLSIDSVIVTRYRSIPVVCPVPIVSFHIAPDFHPHDYPSRIFSFFSLSLFLVFPWPDFNFPADHADQCTALCSFAENNGNFLSKKLYRVYGWMERRSNSSVVGILYQRVKQYRRVTDDYGNLYLLFSLINNEVKSNQPRETEIFTTSNVQWYYHLGIHETIKRKY